MKKDELVRLYSNLYNTTLTDAAQILKNMGDFIEDVVAMGETLVLPGVITIGTKMSKARRVYDFGTGDTRMTTPKCVPCIKAGVRLKRAAEGAPVTAQ